MATSPFETNKLLGQEEEKLHQQIGENYARLCDTHVSDVACLDM